MHRISPERTKARPKRSPSPRPHVPAEVGADGLAAGKAVAAAPAGKIERGDHALAGREVLYLRPDLFDHAGDFVPKDDRDLSRREFAVADGEVELVYRAGLDAEQDLVRARSRHGH